MEILMNNLERPIWIERYAKGDQSTLNEPCYEENETGDIYRVTNCLSKDIHFHNLNNDYKLDTWHYNRYMYETRNNEDWGNLVFTNVTQDGSYFYCSQRGVGIGEEVHMHYDNNYVRVEISPKSLAIIVFPDHPDYDKFDVEEEEVEPTPEDVPAVLGKMLVYWNHR